MKNNSIFKFRQLTGSKSIPLHNVKVHDGRVCIKGLNI